MSEHRDRTAGRTQQRPTRREVADRLASAQKSNRGAAGYSRWVNRPLGRQVAVAAFRRGLTPNQVSLASAALTFSGIAVIAVVRPTWWVAVAITALLVLGYAFDSADGQVARLRGGGSPAGEWLDHVLDALKISTIHLALAIAWYRFYPLPSHAWLLVPLGFGAVSAVFFFAIVLSDMLRRISRANLGGTAVTTASINPGEPAPILRSLLVLPNDYGMLCVLMLLLPWSLPFRLVYTALFAANVVFLLAGCARWFGEMRLLGTQR